MAIAGAFVKYFFGTVQPGGGIAALPGEEGNDGFYVCGAPISSCEHFVIDSSQHHGWSSSMFIRDAAVADLSQIVTIYNSTIACHRVTADLHPVSVDSRLSWFQSHSPEKRPLWVMESNGTVVGWLGFQSFYYGRPAYDTTAELSIYVSPDNRRQGIGHALLRQAIDRSPALGIKTLLGFIFAHNQPSLRLFEQFGFQRWGHLPSVAEFNGLSRDLVIMGRPVNSV